ncbi:MAG: hypothetical protein F6K00_04525 [Leptolyngbya sp. SIOISBB]|nr:hypothetical protein [Leptolyngbya sp. SIOISBB]
MRAAYSLYLGISTLCQKDYGLTLEEAAIEPDRNAFRQGITTEVLHPKTALFFLAFVLQFVNPAGI